MSYPMTKNEESDVEESESDDETMILLTVPLTDPDEETVVVSEQIDFQDMVKLRRVDPFLYHSIRNEIRARNVCTFEGGSGSFADGGVTSAVGLYDELQSGKVARGLQVSHSIPRSQSFPPSNPRRNVGVERRVVVIGEHSGGLSSHSNAADVLTGRCRVRRRQRFSTEVHPKIWYARCF